MVFKFDYRHEAWFGIGKANADASESFSFLVVMIGAGIACFVAPVMAISGLLQPAGDNE
ncbi:hypothetical protein P245_19760 [Comamonas thiooxydans]|uniref:Uncharacterized protein n=2 Tax=Comamonas thiooxydans TaxID=363952 RepID=A0A0E3BCK6_9BURK|nr:hypothetical protein P245_19760 [Comamonas thiooxydans]